MSQNANELDDLSVYPTPDPAPPKGPRVVAIGDLHANPMKAIYYAIKYNVIQLSEADYFELYEIYKRVGNVSDQRKDADKKIPVPELNEASQAILARAEYPLASLHAIEGQLSDERYLEQRQMKLSDAQKQGTEPLSGYQAASLIERRMNEIVFGKDISEEQLKWINDWLPTDPPWTADTVKNDLSNKQTSRLRQYWNDASAIFPQFTEQQKANKQLVAKQQVRDRTPELKANLEAFDRIINGAERSPHFAPGSVLLYIGDVYTDRGAHDGLVQSVIEALGTQQIQETLLLGNHDAYLIQLVESGFAPELMVEIDQFNGSSAQGNSTIMLLHGLKEGIYTEEELTARFKEHYFNKLKVLSYSLTPDTNSINVYTHAPMPAGLIPALARRMGVVYQDFTPQHLASTINQINAKFQEHLQAGTVHELYEMNDPNGRPIDPKLLTAAELKKLIEINPVYVLMWARKTPATASLFDQPVTRRPYNAMQYHGHDKESADSKFRVNLDDEIGKPHSTKAQGSTPAVQVEGRSELNHDDQMKMRENLADRIESRYAQWIRHNPIEEDIKSQSLDPILKMIREGADLEEVRQKIVSAREVAVDPAKQHLSALETAVCKELRGMGTSTVKSAAEQLLEVTRDQLKQQIEVPRQHLAQFKDACTFPGWPERIQEADLLVQAMTSALSSEEFVDDAVVKRMQAAAETMAGELKPDIAIAILNQEYAETVLKKMDRYFLEFEKPEWITAAMESGFEGGKRSPQPMIDAIKPFREQLQNLALNPKGTMETMCFKVDQELARGDLDPQYKNLLLGMQRYLYFQMGELRNEPHFQAKSTMVTAYTDLIDGLEKCEKLLEEHISVMHPNAREESKELPAKQPKAKGESKELKELRSTFTRAADHVRTKGKEEHFLNETTFQDAKKGAIKILNQSSHLVTRRKLWNQVLARITEIRSNLTSKPESKTELTGQAKYYRDKVAKMGELKEEIKKTSEDLKSYQPSKPSR